MNKGDALTIYLDYTINMEISLLLLYKKGEKMMRKVRFPGRVRVVSPRPKVEEAPKVEEPKVEEAPKKKSSKK